MNLTTVTESGIESVVVMSSLEIAKLTNKDHKHVIRDIRAMLKCIPDGPDLDHVKEEKDIRGYTSKISLNYNLTMTLITGYSIELRHKVINRWQELEQQITKTSLPDFTNPVIAARAWADEMEGRLIAEKKVEEAQPAIGFYDAVGDSTSLTSVGDAAKSLGFGRNHFFKWLRNKEFLMKDYNTPYQKWIEARYFQVKYQSYVDEFGEVKHRPVTFITGKGLQYLQKQLD